MRYELKHDKLAAQIFLRASSAAKARRRAAEVYALYEEIGAERSLSTEELKYLAQFVAVLAAPPALQALMERSQAELDARTAAEKDRLEAELREKQGLLEQAQQQRKRATLFGRVGFVLAAVAITAGIWAYGSQQKTEEALIEAQKSKTEALAQADTARTKSLQADSSAQVARDREQKALEAQTLATEALYQARGNAEVAVATLLEVAREAVYHLEYAKALPSLLAAAKLGQDKKAVWLALYEIAYFHIESGQQRGTVLTILRTMSTLLGKPAAVTATAHTSRKELSDLLKKLDAHHFKAMEYRYYPTMIKVKGWTFVMGCVKPSDCADQPDSTRFRVTLSDYEIAETETTYWQWALFCAARSKKLSDYAQSFGNDGDNPAANMDWYAACEYANWRNTQCGLTKVYHIDSIGKKRFKWTVSPTKAKGFVLPSEAQWEYAARGGIRQDTFEFSGSDTLDQVAWYYVNRNINGVDRTHPVKKKKANALGLYDMSGSIWEWCWDWYDDYPEKQKKDYAGPEEGSFRVFRGGSWNGHPLDARVVVRNVSYTPDNHNSIIGFRLARQQ